MPFGNVNVDYAPCKAVGQLKSAELYMLGMYLLFYSEFFCILRQQRNVFILAFDIHLQSIRYELYILFILIFYHITDSSLCIIAIHLMRKLCIDLNYSNFIQLSFCHMDANILILELFAMIFLRKSHIIPQRCSVRQIQKI